MNLSKIVGLMTIFLFAVLAFSSVAVALPLVIEEVQIDDITVTEGAVNRLDLERGNEFEVEIRFTPTADIDDMEIEASIKGFEFNDFEAITDVTHTADYDAGVTYVRRLHLTISEFAEEDDYKVRIIMANRNGDIEVRDYNIKIDVPRHALRIEDILLFPGGSVQAGRALLATVRVENVGEKTEDDVRVSISIPELGLVAADYIDEIDPEDEEETEEIFLRIPNTVPSGQYNVRIDVAFDQLHEVITENVIISIIGDPEYAPMDEQEPETVITVGSVVESVTPGQGGATYPITITNNEARAKTFSLIVTGTEDWADVEVNPASTVIIDGRGSKLLSVYVTPREGVDADSKTFTVDVVSNNKVIQQLPLTANILVTKRSGWDIFVKILEAILVILVVLVIIIALIIGFQKLGSKGNENDPSETQTYY